MAARRLNPTQDLYERDWSRVLPWDFTGVLLTQLDVAEQIEHHTGLWGSDGETCPGGDA